MGTSHSRFLFDVPLATKILEAQSAIRRAPTDAALRIYLFQLHCTTSSWDKALAQLQASAQFDPAAIPMAQLYREAIRCEALRADVFAGNRRPSFLGSPDEWTSFLCEALSLIANKKYNEATELRERAFDAAAAAPGRIGEDAFEWLADADSRLGPMCEAFINGQYYWIPFDKIASIAIEPPADLRDLVWAVGSLKLRNGGEHPALFPARYPGSETASDAAALARVTEWTEQPGDTWIGCGQKMFSTDSGEYSLLDIREIVFDA
jgi:type VI secretion system protein ImpE